MVQTLSKPSHSWPEAARDLSAPPPTQISPSGGRADLREPDGLFGRSWNVGRLFGIPLHVHPTFAILLAWIAISDLARGLSAVGVLLGVLLVVSVFACVVAHELSHALVARRFGIETLHITLLPIGGIARLKKLPELPRHELLVAIAGPLTSLALGGSLFLLRALLGGLPVSEQLDLGVGGFLTSLGWINVSLALFNLLPAFPMDGGRVLRAALALRLGLERATRVAAYVGQGLAVVFGMVGLLFNPLLALIAFFVWVGAKSEVSLVEVRALLRRVPVAQAMISQFHVLSLGDPLARALELTASGFQQDFPVLDGERLVGILTRSNLLSGVKAGGLALRVEAAMDRNFEVAEPWEMLDTAFERLQRSRCPALVVTDHGRLVGLVTAESIGQLLALEKARKTSAASNGGLRR